MILAQNTCNLTKISKHDKVTAQEDASLPYYDWVEFDANQLSKISKHHYFLRNENKIKYNDFNGSLSNTCYPFNKEDARDKCYTYNPFVAGKLRDYGGQCVAFVWGRVYQKLDIKLPRSFYGDAISWWHKNKHNKPSRLRPYYLNTTISSNTVAIYKGVKKHPTGHVAFVEKVIKKNGQTFVYFNEANWLTYNKNWRLSGWHVRGDAKLKCLTLQQFVTRNKRGVKTILGYVHFVKYINRRTF